MTTHYHFLIETPHANLSVSSRVIFPVESRLKLPLNELGYLLEASPRQQRQKLTATLPAAGPSCNGKLSGVRQDEFLPAVLSGVFDG